MQWKSVKAPYVTIRNDTACASFSTLFRTKYIPPHITAIKIIEFESLQQGENSVQEYEPQFTNLSRFAPSLVKTEPEKVMRFTRGLNPHIKLHEFYFSIPIYPKPSPQTGCTSSNLFLLLPLISFSLPNDAERGTRCGPGRDGGCRSGFHLKIGFARNSPIMGEEEEMTRKTPKLFEKISLIII